MYNKSPNALRAIPIIIIIAIVAIVIFAWGIPVWLADLSLDTQMYSNKAGVDFITVNLLDWAAIWVPLIPAAIATVILLHPKKFLSVLPVKGIRGHLRASILFSIVIFGISYFLSWIIGDMSYGMFMAHYLQRDPTSGFVDFFASFKALLIPFDTSQYSVNVLLSWQYLTMPIMNAILTAFLFRMIFEMIGAKVNGGYAIEFLGRLFLIIGIILGYFYLASPLSTYDSVERTWLYILPLTMWTMLGTGIFALVFAATSKRLRDREEVAGGTFIIAVIIVIGMIIGPCIAAAGSFFSREGNWPTLVWGAKIEKQVEQTRIASDLTGFTNMSMTDLINRRTNPEIANKIRPFDQNSSRALLESKITANYEMTNNDSDIIVMNQSEYWVSPIVFFPGAQSFDSAMKRNAIFTHTRGYVAMDAHEGDVLQDNEYLPTFNVTKDYPVYFGEGYRNEILLNLTSLNVTEYDSSTFHGAPDGNLSGYLANVKLLSTSTDFLPLLNREISFLHRTNIFDRVTAILLPHMYMDPDPYLVFDTENQKLFYSVPVYISIPGFTYFQSDYKRFLGWIILDCYDGTMQFYLNHKLDTDSLISFAKVYVDTSIYPWINATNAPDWLKSQFRYPEGLYEQQLATDYTYHVTNAETWRAANDFFARPPMSDLYFVMMDIGEGLEYVGFDLVVPTSGTVALAGMYIVRQNFDHFGETRFYRRPSGTSLMGPETANSTFQNYPAISQSITQIPNKDVGNILLYAFAHSVYYVVPIYSTSNTTGLQTLNYVGLVNGFNETEVAWGHTSQEAFNVIKQLHPETEPVPAIQVNCTTPSSTVTTPDLANIVLSMTNTDTNLSALPLSVTAGLLVYSSGTTLFVNGSSLGSSTNYTLGTWSMYPTQLRQFMVQLNMSLGNFSSRNMPFKFYARLSNGTKYSTETKSILFQLPSYAATNITAHDITMGFILPALVQEPSNANLQLTVRNNNVTMSNVTQVQVNLTLFSVNATNVTVTVPGLPSMQNGSFASDVMYPGHVGRTFTVIDEILTAQATYGVTVSINLNLGSYTSLEFVYRLDLIVNNIVVGTTLLRVITWTK
nr:UPF0182 family protein [Candidatus Sigynarchaeota archaeon]